ncbi:MAG: site-specific tyrosine recombinase [Planctomycetaceae bacterium]|nr:site-specific tyrosine recombinase [Planctomycetaceae bacterium]
MTGSSRSLTKKIPGYLLHKPSGRARVRIDGKDHYLGPYGSEESRIEYGRLISQHAAGIPVDPFKTSGPEDTGLTVNELTLAYKRHADVHYQKNGKPTSEIHCINQAMRPLLEFYGGSPVDEFGPLALKVVRAKMVDLKWVRRGINKAIGRIRSIFRWGVANELVEPSTLQKLEAVAPLLEGRTTAKDNPPRTGVSDENVAAVQADVSELVKDLIDLQRLTGARSGELVSLTTAMIDRSGPVWVATITDHKTVHHGHARVITIGPKAQLVLAKYLSANPGKPLFDICRTAYCRAITRSCERLKITRWVPHQLRHTYARTVREIFGPEHAQSGLGHSSMDMTEHYAKLGLQKSAEVAMKIG